MPNNPEWRIDLPEEDRRADLRSQLDQWIRQPSLRELAESFGQSIDLTQPTALLFRDFDDISAEHWDTRKGAERNLAAQLELNPEQVSALNAALKSLGLKEPVPPRRSSYDYLVILGGLIRACITRPRYGAALVDAGVNFEVVLALGGFRPLGGNELDLAASLGVAADNEFHAMITGVKSAFDSGEPTLIETSAQSEPTNGDYAIARFADPRLLVVAAPSREPEKRRANTADTFAWWAEREGWRGKSALIVTNPIYVPYQSAAAIQTLAMPYGVEVEVVGVDKGASDLGSNTQSFTQATYLQEVRSAIVGNRQLFESLDVA